MKRAVGKIRTKYAVCLWGVEQDEAKHSDGSVGLAGLTFGPATGEDYTNAYRACPGTSKESPGDCLHWMSWEEILKRSGTNPHSFDACLANGCTHSVEISIPADSPLSGEDYANPKLGGDGAGILFDSIAGDYRKWNYDVSTLGGWPASRIRATLNGADNYTDLSIAKDDCLEASNCLLATFPKVLRENIVAKAIKSAVGRGNVSESNTVTYDKLWLFSKKEIYGGNKASNWLSPPNEGNLYQRSKALIVTTSDFRASDCTELGNYDESGFTKWWWLRSIDYSDSLYVSHVCRNGDWANDYANLSDCGIAPGFCIT